MIGSAFNPISPKTEEYKESKEEDLKKLLPEETVSSMRAAAAIPEVADYILTPWAAFTLRLSTRACQISGVVIGLFSSVVATMVYSMRTIIQQVPNAAAFSSDKLCSLEPFPHCIWKERVLSWPHLAGTLVIGMVAAMALLKAQALDAILEQLSRNNENVVQVFLLLGNQ